MTMHPVGRIIAQRATHPSEDHLEMMALAQNLRAIDRALATIDAGRPTTADRPDDPASAAGGPTHTV